jgi:hypothetical protein
LELWGNPLTAVQVNTLRATLPRCSIDF